MSIIVPEVYATSVLEKMENKLKITKLAQDVTDDVFLLSSEGMTVNFPKWQRLDPATELAKGDSVVADEMSQSNSTAQVVTIAKGVKIYDQDALSVRGSMLNIAIENTGGSLAEKLESLVVDAIDSEVTLKSATDTADGINQTNILDGMGLLGDDLDYDSFAGLVFNSGLLQDLLSMPLFVQNTYTTAQAGNGIIKNGMAGTFMGIPVYISNAGTYDTVNSEYKSYIIKKGSVGVMYKKALTVELERLPRELASNVITSSMVACKLLDDSGVVVLKNTII